MSLAGGGLGGSRGKVVVGDRGGRCGGGGGKVEVEAGSLANNVVGGLLRGGSKL